MKRSKKYINAKKIISNQSCKTLSDFVEVLLSASFTKFVSSVDLVVKLNLNASKQDQQIRGAVVLPHNFGKKAVIVAITDDINSAKEAGADFAGNEDLLDKIKDGWTEFDVIVTSPKFMPQIGKFGKILGPKGLVPNPKTGNVGTDVGSLVREFRNGKRKYSSDSFGNVHICVGKVNIPAHDIVENIKCIIDLLKSLRPSSVKGDYIKKVVLSTTMGPAVEVPLSVF